MKFKKMLCKYDKGEREQILNLLRNWLMQQIAHDGGAAMCYNSIQEAYQVNSWADNKAFKDHYLWFSMPNHDSCLSFQEIVRAKLAVPKKNMAVAPTTSSAKTRKPIPKKIRGETWTAHFNDSTKGGCYCCKKELNAFDDWHAGHIISRSNGGPDTANNLRPVCGSCNMSMGTENMDEFKVRCYPNIVGE